MEKDLKVISHKELLAKYDVQSSDLIYKHLNFDWKFCVADFDDECDFSMLNALVMLRQLLLAGRGNQVAFTCGVSNVAFNEFNDKFIDFLKTSITYSLKDFVCIECEHELCNLNKVELVSGKCYSYYLCASVGGNNPAHDMIVLNTNHEVFSLDWVNEAIREVEGYKAINDKWLGISMRRSSQKSRLPILGDCAYHWMEFLPQRWSITDKRCFVADLMFLHGKLDFRGEAFRYEFEAMSRHDKADMVKRWIQAYLAIEEEPPVSL